MLILKTLFTSCLLLISLSSALGDDESVVDFCVADLNLPKGPAGYPCKNPANLTVNDFVFTGLGKPAKLDSLFKLGLTFAIDSTFPALNSLGLSMSRLDLGVNGVVPLHTHRVSEVLIVIEGTIIAGFIGSDNTPYYKILNKGDIIIFPQSLLHFQVNIGSTPAVLINSLNSANPGLQITPISLFGNNLPCLLLTRVSLLGLAEVQRLKGIMGGSS